MMEPARIVHRQIWRESGLSSGSRSIPEETAVALTYNGGTYAVMMATPADLEDFAIGFSLSEGVISSSSDIDSLDIVRLDDGVELRLWLSKPKADRLQERRRHIAGPTGCGLCGIESIAEAMRPAAVIGRGQQFSSEQIMAAMQKLPLLQNSTPRRARFTPRRFGISPAASLPCARTLAVITRSTSFRATSACVRCRERWDHTSHQPGFSGDGAEKRCDRRASDSVGFSADSACRSHSGRSRYHPCGHCARGRIRSVHASLPNFI